VRAFALAVRDAIDWIAENEDAALDYAVDVIGVERETLMAGPPQLFVKCLDQTEQMTRFGELMVDAGFLESLPDYGAYTSDMPFSEEEMCTEPNLVVWNPGEFAA
jgi:hypothetical protein